MAGSSEDYALGASALLGRAIGEVNGMHRRVDKLEREVLNLQERLEVKPSRLEFLMLLFVMILIAILLGAGLVLLDGGLGTRLPSFRVQ